MEEAHAVVALYNVVLVTGLSNLVVSNRAARLHDVRDTELDACVDVVTEREKRVG